MPLIPQADSAFGMSGFFLPKFLVNILENIWRNQ
jgi:hypothetical protein